MKVIIDVCQNTDLVELLSFAKSRQMCVVGFPDNPELEFLRSEVPIAASWRTPGKKRSGFWESRKRFHQRSRKQHSPSHSSTSASGDEYYFASESGSPLATPNKNRHSKSTKWRKRRQTIPAENKAMCTKCGAYITSDRIFALMNHASAHSDFARYKCSACDYYHKSFMKVRAHIHLEHDGDPSIKQQDQMNNAERLRIKQIAHECFPSHVVNPSMCMNNVPINAQHSPMKTMQQNNCQPALRLLHVEVLECSAASLCSNVMENQEKTDALHFEDNAELCSREELKQSNTSSSEELPCCALENNDKPSDYDSDCIILD